MNPREQLGGGELSETAQELYQLIKDKIANGDYSEFSFYFLSLRVEKTPRIINDDYEIHYSYQVGENDSCGNSLQSVNGKNIYGLVFGVCMFFDQLCIDRLEQSFSAIPQRKKTRLNMKLVRNKLTPFPLLKDNYRIALGLDSESSSE